MGGGTRENAQKLCVLCMRLTPLRIAATGIYHRSGSRSAFLMEWILLAVGENQALNCLNRNEQRWHPPPLLSTNGLRQ